MACHRHAIVACHKWHAKDPHAENPICDTFVHPKNVGTTIPHPIECESRIVSDHKTHEKIRSWNMWGNIGTQIRSLRELVKSGVGMNMGLRFILPFEIGLEIRNVKL
ncbi:hypothetical protein C2G38_2186638 [Gigaspora rosea]|uniref:Uncharacterized protein n=1 Tax=Gigaspora rosea TaxID=44941 RepID=A0A397V5G4_9GLOM|nr:hypothetical protein C2G38_2186638 [Gigaspora rosea]